MMESRGSNGVTNHYDALLAEIYTWMCGGFAEKVTEQRALFDALGVKRRGSGRALDLGCGPGFQAVALAERGFAVTAIDTSRGLLAELEARRGALPIVTVAADITADLSMIGPGLEVAVCMGDTLTHLPSRDTVIRLIADVHARMNPGGAFILTFRDLTTELTGTARFIPVRSDADRIMTCFLEYEPETVVVHDLVHTREGDTWTLRASRYRKLRLGVDWVRARLAEAGFVLRRHDPGGRLAVLVAEKPGV